MALPTKGRVIIETTAGELDVELWSKEAPKACRNFIALSLEGYYDGVIFHRVVPGFLIQTGDKTGTGGGGESFFGEPFEDEIHPRLRFPHRGIVAMANQGTKNTNDSQFIITLGKYKRPWSFPGSVNLVQTAPKSFTVKTPCLADVLATQFTVSYRPQP